MSFIGLWVEDASFKFSRVAVYSLQKLMAAVACAAVMAESHS